MRKLFCLLALCCFAAGAWAHGDEPHADSDHAGHAHAAPDTVLETSAAVPTLTTQSETFELVARLYPHELGLYLDDWASNAPVLHADIEVEVDGGKARGTATFHADHGDYAVTDPALLEILHAEGEHALLFTIVAGKSADLLTGELHVHADEDAAGAAGMLPSRWQRWLIYSLAGVVLLVLGALYVRRSMQVRKGEQA